MTSAARWQPEEQRLADDLYLTAHDDVSGRPRLPQRILALGLAGALLAELAAGDHILIDNGIVLVGTAESAPRDALAHEVLDQVKSERLAVHDWLAFFSQDAAARVASRMGRAGVLALRQSSIPLRPGRWMPINPNTAEMPRVNLVTPLMRGRPLSEHYAALGGLIEAIGLGAHARVLWEIHDAPHRLAALHRAVDALRADLRELILYTERAVASAYVTHRA